MGRPLVFDIDHYIAGHVTYNQTTMQRRTLLILAGLIALPALALAAVYLLVSPEKLRPVLERQLSDALQRPVRVGTLSLSLVPVALAAQQLEVGEDAAFGPGPFAKADGLTVKPRLLPLLSGDVVVDSVAIHAPRIELKKNAEKRWNYESLGKKSSGGSADLQIGELTISDATLGVQEAGAERAEYQRIGVTVKNYVEGKPFDLALKARTQDGAELGAAGIVESNAQKTVLRNVALQFAGLQGKLDGEIGMEALALKVEIPSSPIAQAAPLFLPKETNVKGQIAAQIAVSGSTSAPRIQGKVQIEGFEASGGQIKQPVRTKQLSLELTPERLSLLPASIESGSTNLQIYGVVSQYQIKPMLEATLLAPQAKLDELLAIARAYGAVSSADELQGSGQLRLQVRVHGPLSGKAPLHYAGSGALENASLHLPSLTKPLQVHHADFKFAEDAVALDNISAALGSTQATGAIKLANFRDPRADFNLKANKVSLEELRGWVRESKGESKPMKLQAQGSVEIGRLDLMNIVLERMSAQCNFHDGHLALRPLRASMYGGTHTGALDIDMRQSPPVYKLQSRLEKIESSDLLAAATAVKGIVSGPIFSDLDLHFSPGEPAAMAKSLDGRVSLRLDQGRIANLNLTNELAAVAKFLGYSSSASQYTQFRSLTGDLSIQNGQAQTQNLKLDMEHISATITGIMNLADQSLDLKILSVLDTPFSNQVGGSKIGGFMTAALANGQGGLMIPATIKGSFQKPIMAPDASAMAKLKLQSFNPKDPKQMMDQVEGIMGIFKKKK